MGSVTRYLADPMTAAQVKGNVQHDGIGPADVTQTSDNVQSGCELVIYHSDALAAVAGLNDPVGSFVVDLLSSTANGGGYNASDVESLLYDTDVSGGC